MLLKDWAARHGILPTHPTSEFGAVSVMFDRGVAVQASTELRRLLDYWVVEQLVFITWLLPRKPAYDREFWLNAWQGLDGEGI